MQEWVEISFFDVDEGFRTLERFPLDVSQNSYRGFPRARKSDSDSSDGNGGGRDGEGILEGP